MDIVQCSVKNLQKIGTGKYSSVIQANEVEHLEAVTTILNELLHTISMPPHEIGDFRIGRYNEKYWNEIRPVYCKAAPPELIFEHHTGWKFLSVFSEDESLSDALDRECSQLYTKLRDRTPQYKL